MELDHERTLWQLTRGQRFRYAAAIVAMGVGYAFFFGVPLVAQRAIDAVTGDGVDAARVVWTAAAWIVGLTVLSGSFQYLRGRWAAIASEAIVRRLRNRLYAHLNELPATYHDKADTGDLVQRCSSDVETIRVFLSAQIVDIGRAVLMLMIVVPLMLAQSVTLALVSLVMLPVILAFSWFFFRRIQVLFKETDEAEGRMTTVLQENLTGIRVVRAFARQEFECEKFAARNVEHRDRYNRLIQLLGKFWGISDLLCMTQVGLTLFWTATWMMQGRIGVGTLFAFTTFVSMFIWPVRQTGRILADTGKALVALRRVREILDAEPESNLGAPGAPLEGGIRFDHVTFAFDETPALSDVSFELKPKETLALIGPPGAGKSTIVQLLLRLYDYEHGSIRLDGKELGGLDRRYVRSQFSVVMQEPFLYSKSIGANVRLGRGTATDAEVQESASDAAIHGAIEDFEHGYDTLVGERGVTLSGGQRQRVAIARALLKDSPILVLDDALSAIDTETEASILEALRRRRGKRTTLLIAHRLTSIAHADRVLVLDGGRVVEEGTHDELVRRAGPYHRLWRIQEALEVELHQ